MVDTSNLPTNWTPNHAPTAQETGYILDMLTRVAAPPRAKLRRTSNQSIPDGAWTAVSWNTQDKLRNMTWLLGTNPTRVTCTIAGMYRVVGTVQYSNGSSTNTRSIGIKINGTTQICMNRIPATSQAIGITVAATVDLAVGDYFEIVLWQNAGSAQNITNNTFTDGDAGYVFCEWLGESGS